MGSGREKERVNKIDNTCKASRQTNMNRLTWISLFSFSWTFFINQQLTDTFSVRDIVSRSSATIIPSAPSDTILTVIITSWVTNSWNIKYIELVASTIDQRCITTKTLLHANTNKEFDTYGHIFREQLCIHSWLHICIVRISSHTFGIHVHILGGILKKNNSCFQVFAETYLRVAACIGWQNSNHLSQEQK